MWPRFLLDCCLFQANQVTGYSMLIDQYYSVHDGKISFTREQGSNFAKQVADDFNPIHDPDSRRFCVPGDLLFSVILASYGLSRHMEFRFTGMVDDSIELLLPPDDGELVISDSTGKEYLTISRSGDNIREERVIDGLTRRYVEFSGHTFPHILVPLLAEQGVMINPDRPMVFYESMVIDLERLDFVDLQLVIDRNELAISGKRGEVQLAFNLVGDGEIVGRGKKRMVLGGLRAYDREVMDATITDVEQRKRQYLAASGGVPHR